ncbi:MAG TPA: DUF4388 domain-containing protein [Thermoanaerobaculia bacterium]|nr:DUF4388 domain-containing protein [Thermoanaerobaculia bacterium]
MKLEGDLPDIDLIRQLLELADTRFTGAIRFEHDGIIKILYFRDGDVLSASTNDRNDSVDEILHRAGKVNRDHVRQALGKRKENETLGDALLSLGFITRKELAWARRVQIVGIIRSLLAWDAGSFQLVQDYLPKREEGTLFHLPQIILELAVTDPDRTGVERRTAGGEMVFRKAPLFPEKYARLALNEDADAIVEQVDGMRTAAEVAAATRLETFAVYKLLLALHTLGLLEGDEPEVTHEVLRPAETPAAPPPFEFPAEPHAPPPRRLDPSRTNLVPGIHPPPEAGASWEPEPPDEEVTGPAAEPVGDPLVREIEPVAGADELGEATSDQTLRRRAGRNSTLLLALLLIVLAAAAWGGYRWLRSGGGEETAATIADEGATIRDDPEFIAAEPDPPDETAPAPTTTLSPGSVPASPPPAAPSAEPEAPPPPRAVEAGDPLRRRYQEMAERWTRENRTVPFSLQFSILCRTDSVTRSLGAGDRVWFIPIAYRGESCFRMFWGTYSTREAAEAARSEIPGSLRGSTPVVVRPEEILR